MKKIHVTKTHLPDRAKFDAHIDDIWKSVHLTNHGPKLFELENRLCDVLNVDYLQVVTNGTLALQIALKALDLTRGKIITTPFSYVATTSSILWERCTPVFADIDPNTFCIDPVKVEAAITPDTKAILAVHVFGYPCDVDALQDIATRHGLKLIYDAAHAFGCTYRGKSLLSYGDVSTGSFHATKVFHTIEGGCLVTNDEHIHKQITLLKMFGHIGDEHFDLGINAKASEFQAAMGLCNLDDFSSIVEGRKIVSDMYDDILPKDKIQRPFLPDELDYNYGYYPVVFENSLMRARAIQAMGMQNIYPRRYFFPSLNTLPYLERQQDCPISESICDRIVCLPLYGEIERDTIETIAKTIKRL